tara:strand:+ start:309 stop:446 length:138 start_codon:yes stop_codon:yes gene_type:complete
MEEIKMVMVVAAAVVVVVPLAVLVVAADKITARVEMVDLRQVQDI